MQIDYPFECCKKNYYFGGHSLKCKLVNAFDADFSRNDEEIRNITIEEIECLS